MDIAIVESFVIQRLINRVVVVFYLSDQREVWYELDQDDAHELGQLLIDRLDPPAKSWSVPSPLWTNHQNL